MKYDKINTFRYFTDILNMLQGVYIFVIFVLKRNVLTMIFGNGKKKSSRFASKHSGSKSKTLYSEVSFSNK